MTDRRAEQQRQAIALMRSERGGAIVPGRLVSNGLCGVAMTGAGGKGIPWHPVGKAPRRRQPGTRNRAFTGAEVETAVRLSIAGESDPAIARHIDRPTASIRRVLDRTGLPGLRCNGGCHGLRLCVPTAAWAALDAEATARGLTPTRLAEQLLTFVASDGLFKAILEE